MKLFLIFFLSLIFFSCNEKSNDNTSVAKSIAELKADSLTAIADSLASARNRGRPTQSNHLHAGDAAAAAHQDPAKTRRMRKRQAETYDSRKKSRQAANRAIQEKLQDIQKREEDLF